MLWFLSYVGSNFALIAVVVLAVLALGAVAWFAKNWKVAVVAVLVLAAGLAYQHIDKTAYQRRVAEEAAEQIAAAKAEAEKLQARLDTVNAINQQNAERAMTDAAEIERLQKLAGQTPADSTPALKRDAVGRVRNIR